MPNWLLCVYLIHTASAIDVAMVTNDHGDELVDHLMEPWYSPSQEEGRRQGPQATPESSVTPPRKHSAKLA